MRTRRNRTLWSVPKSIAFLILFVVISFAGAILVAGAFFRGCDDAGSLLGLALVILGPIGAIAATVELIRAAVSTDGPARSDRLDT